MPLRAKYFAIFLTLVFLCIVLVLIRRRKLHETYSLFWFAMALGLFVVAVWSQLLVWIRDLIGAASANSVIFTLGFLFVIIFLLHLTVRMSHMRNQIRELTQHQALLSQQKSHPPGDESHSPSDSA
jgi:hypothetical protein